MQDYYAVLGVAPTASPAEIRRAYLRLVRRYHPDAHRGGHGWQMPPAQQAANEQRMKLINEAYAVLRDPRRRAAYDARYAAVHPLRASRRAEPESAQRRSASQEALASEMTWLEGLIGFVRELKRELREE
jgi:curved DNA-binding protein CbpA